MQEPSENWFLLPRPLVKVKQKYANGIKLENKFSEFNNKKYFNTEIDPMPIEEDVVRTKNKTSKRIEYGKSWIRKNKKRVKVITQSLKTDQDKKMLNTKNLFSILEYFSEEHIEQLLNSEILEDKPKKKKCPFCGFKTTCHENKHKCNASGAICKYCCKPDHLPKSLLHLQMTHMD